MSTSKHPLSGHGENPIERDDLQDDPGIGASRGTTMSGEDPHILREDAVNTEEGDTANETNGLGQPTSIERQRSHP
jgi:hypothetical protein